VRTSSYTIYVDLPDNSDEMLVVHGYSGAYDKVSRRVATFLRALETTKPPKPLYGTWTPEPPIDGQVTSPSAATLGVLKQRGYLTDLTPQQETEHFSRVATNLHQQSMRPNYIFMPTYDCNLRCGYWLPGCDAHGFAVCAPVAGHEARSRRPHLRCLSAD